MSTLFCSTCYVKRYTRKDRFFSRGFDITKFFQWQKILKKRITNSYFTQNFNVLDHSLSECKILHWDMHEKGKWSAQRVVFPHGRYHCLFDKTNLTITTAINVLATWMHVAKSRLWLDNSDVKTRSGFDFLKNHICFKATRGM